MHDIDIYIDDGGRERKRRRRRKWLVPLLVGFVAAFALGREKSPVAVASAIDRAPVDATPVDATPVDAVAVVVAPPSGPVVVSTPAVVDVPAVETPTETAAPAPLVPARLAAGPLRIDFGDGPVTRGIPAQMATIRNDGGQPLPRITVAVDPPFLATNGCVRELAPGAECMIAVVFAPPQPGKFAGSLRIASAGQNAKIALRGSVPRPREISPPTNPAPPVLVTHVEPPANVPPQLPPARVLCFQPPLLRFTSTGKQTITLANPEAIPLRVVAVVPLGRQGQTVSGYEIEARKCLRVLKPGQQCRFTVRANELALQMHETMQLTVYYEDPVTGGRRAARFDSNCGR